jgi:hypothetical protein
LTQSIIDTDTALRELGLGPLEIAALRIAHPLELAARYVRSAALGAPTALTSMEFSDYICRSHRARPGDS